MKFIVSSRFVFAAALLVFYGCGGPKTTSLTPTPSKEVIKKAPDWFLDPPDNKNHLYGVGTATSRDMQVGVRKARTEAQLDLAQQLGTYMGNLTKNFQEETGMGEDSELLTQFSSVTKAVTQETLIGAKQDDKEIIPEGEIYRVYILMSLPLGKANQRLMDKIKADQNLLTQLRATQAFSELEKELEKNKTVE